MAHLLLQMLLDHVERVGRDEEVRLIQILNNKVLVLVHLQNELLDGRVPAKKL